MTLTETEIAAMPIHLTRVNGQTFGDLMCDLPDGIHYAFMEDPGKPIDDAKLVQQLRDKIKEHGFFAHAGQVNGNLLEMPVMPLSKHMLDVLYAYGYNPIREAPNLPSGVVWGQHFIKDTKIYGRNRASQTIEEFPRQQPSLPRGIR